MEVGSLLIYPTHFTADSTRDVRDVLWHGVKQGRGTKIEEYVERIRGDAWDVLGKLLDEAGVLVPVPKHSRHLEGSLWVLQRIALAMYGNDIGEHVDLLLERETPVSSSTGVSSAIDRPSPKVHRDSLNVKRSLFSTSKVTLIDGFVTRGSTLLGCAARIRQFYPLMVVQAFALCRIETNMELREIHEMYDPRIETISGCQYRARR